MRARCVRGGLAGVRAGTQARWVWVTMERACAAAMRWWMVRHGVLASERTIQTVRVSRGGRECGVSRRRRSGGRLCSTGMSDAQIVGVAGGFAFEDSPDRGRVLVSAADTDGAHSLMEWTVASRSMTADYTDRDFGPHQHAEIEELFVVRQGAVDFLLGGSVTTLRANDVVRVPAGTRHGYVNRSGNDVEMLVMFRPGGFEELFVRYRTDQPAAHGDGFAADALRLFATNFEN